jgi:hypothetical protein
MANVRTKDLTSETNVLSTDMVPLDRAGYSDTHKATVEDLTEIERTAREDQDDIIEASCGIATDGTYGVTETASTDTWFLRSADFTSGATGRGGATGALTPNIKNALRLLDSKLYDARTRLSTVENTYFDKKTTISHADILLLNGTPQTLISFASLFPDAPATYAIVIYAAEWRHYSLAAYGTNTQLEIFTKTKSVPMVESSKCLLVNNKDYSGRFVESSENEDAIAANKDIMIQVKSGNPTGGNAANYIEIFVHCKLIDLS